MGRGLRTPSEEQRGRRVIEKSSSGRGIVVDSFCCGSNGGCCDAEGVFRCTHNSQPVPRARAGALASAQALPAEGMARQMGEAGSRSEWQSHLG
eukprot:scaffold9905_cov117-Isochrysis_galbana.AAC.21